MTEALVVISGNPVVNRRVMLSLINRRYNTSVLLRRYTGWTERRIQRYAITLVDEGLLTRSRDVVFGGRGAWQWKYSVTGEGTRALRG